MKIRSRLIFGFSNALLILSLTTLSFAGGGIDPGPPQGGEFFALPGDVIESPQVATYSTNTIKIVKRAFKMSELDFPTRYGVRLNKVIYWSTDPDGNLVRASGLIVTPVGAPVTPIISYQHGTTPDRKGVPSYYNRLENIAVPIIFASLGYSVVAADYLGLGEGTGLHPYLHAETEASACADLLLASRRVIVANQIAPSSQLFLMGYSQGGHATLALQRLLENHPQFGFTIAASAPMAGPYDLLGASLRGALTQPSPNSSAYAAYLLAAMNQVTRWTPSWSQLFIAPYDQKIQELLDMTHTLKQLSDGLPRDPKTFIQPGLIQAMLSPQAHPIKTELEKNSLLNWSPKSPTRLYHGELDVDVPFENSMIAQQAFSSRGSQQVQLISLGAVDHAGGAWPAFRLALQWFELMALHAATPLSDNGTSTTD